MNTIGLDAHSATFTVAILNRQGKLSLCLRRPTSEEQLIEIVSTVKGPKQLVVEESHMAQWIKLAELLRGLRVRYNSRSPLRPVHDHRRRGQD